MFNMNFLNKKRAQFSLLCFTVLGITVLVIYQTSEHRNENKVVNGDTNRGNLHRGKNKYAGISNQNGNAGLGNFDSVHKTVDGISNHDKDAGISNSSENHVLLNSYMRSGSSFMGKILGHRDDVFYYYEPLWTGNIWTYHKGIDEMCSTTTPRCWKKPRVIQISRSILKNVYSCHLRDIGAKLTEKVHTSVKFGGNYSWEQYETCKKSGHDKRYCLTKIEEFCRNHTTRVTKVLRLDLTLADLLMQDNTRLKIVHLFRDPRGTMSSHVFTKWFPTKINDTKAINMDAQVYCGRVKVDILAAISFHERYPDRLRGIQYEDFYNLNEKAKLLYDYLGMDSSQKYLDFVLDQLSRETKYNTTETNESKLFAYRETLPWKVVQIVEKQCADVISLLGLKLFEKEENYMDPNFNLIDGQLRFGLGTH